MQEKQSIKGSQFTTQVGGKTIFCFIVPLTGVKMKITNKIWGYVEQTFDDNGNFLHQEFIPEIYDETFPKFPIQLNQTELPPPQTCFFTFHQNLNSCTTPNANKPPFWIIVEATDFNQANAIAEKNGAYFDGVKNHIDCSCCGDRWRRYRNNKFSTKEPDIFGWEPYKRTDWKLVKLNGQVTIH